MSWFRRDTHPTDEDLSALIDGELAPSRAATLQAHLDSCQSCRARLDELQSVKAMLSGLPRPALPRSFTLTAAPAQASRPRSAPRSLLAFAPAVTLSALVLLLVVDLAVVPATQRSADESGATATLTFDSAQTSKASAEAGAPTPAAALPQQPVPRAAAPQPDAAAPSAGAAQQPTTVPQAFSAPSSVSTPPAPGAAQQPALAPQPAATPGAANSAAGAERQVAPVAPPLPAATVSDGFADSAVAEPFPTDAGASRPPLATGESDPGPDTLRVLELVAGGAFVLSLARAWLRRRAT